MSEDFSFPATVAYLSPPPNPYGRISEIAKSVGVAPYQDGKCAVLMLGDDGNNYDVFEVVLAVLDHIDRATKRKTDTASK